MSRIPPPPPGFVIDDEAMNQQVQLPALPPGFELMANDGTDGQFSDVVGGRSNAPSKQRTFGQNVARGVGGLGLRNVVEGAADLAGVFYDPIADAVNWAGRKLPGVPRQAKARDISNMLLDGLGVPQPETAQERVSGDIGRALTGTALTMGAGGLLNTGRAAVATPGLQSGVANFLLGNPAL